MARITAGPKYRLYKTEGYDLGYKNKRSASGKGPSTEKLAIKPGANGAKRKRKTSDYGIQLRAKQKAKRLYIVGERQFHNYFAKAKRQKGQVGDNLLKLLESRLDNVVYKAGFCLSKDHARQLVSHQHVLVNGHKVNVPSYNLSINDIITLSPKLVANDKLELRYKQEGATEVPTWLDLNTSTPSVKVIGVPDVTELKNHIDINLIVEYYSR